ncbi:MAG: GNAT family N-acetyltransferase [Dehalococcoidales bacterium]|jgi:N-acetylglutamate synthase-like GNAT family acetyltransferase
MPTDEINVTIRSLKKTDFDAVLKLAGKAITHEEMDSLIPGEPSSLCFVAEAEGKIIGFNLACELFVGIPLSKICVIQGIVVDDDYQRLGIGEKLIKNVVDNCSGCKIEVIRALVDETDICLQQFAEHLGFWRSKVANFDKVT